MDSMGWARPGYKHDTRVATMPFSCQNNLQHDPQLSSNVNFERPKHTTAICSSSFIFPSNLVRRGAPGRLHCVQHGGPEADLREVTSRLILKNRTQ